MTPAFAAPARGKAPLRMAFVYVPNGIHMQAFTPQREGRDFDFPRVLEPLKPFRDDMVVFSGLTHNNGRALGDGAGDHARAAASYLTGIHPRKTAGADIKLGVSVDQLAARQIGQQTRFPSLELGCEDGRMVGNCDSGYSCAYSNTISWRGESSPMPLEVNPRAVFERLFGSGEEGEDAAARAHRDRYHKSILDFVREDTQSLQSSLGPTDRRKLDEYLYAIREIERRIERAEKESVALPAGLEAPTGVPVEFADHVKLMFDLMTLALQTDSTRIITFMMGREGSSRTYRELGISDGHHPLSHHRNEPEMVEKICKINRYHMELFAKLVEKMRTTPDGDGSLLDHTMLVYGSGLSDGNRHWHHDLPVVMMGKANGAVSTGRHLRYEKDTPMNNLFVAMLDRMGVRTEKFGDSNGVLDHLALS